MLFGSEDRWCLLGDWILDGGQSSTVFVSIVGNVSFTLSIQENLSTLSSKLSSSIIPSPHFSSTLQLPLSHFPNPIPIPHLKPLLQHLHLHLHTTPHLHTKRRHLHTSSTPLLHYPHPSSRQSINPSVDGITTGSPQTY